MPALKNAKRERFCLEYAVDGNASRSAIEAGYSQKTAGAIGHSLLKYVEIQNRLAELRQESWKRLQMSADEVLANVARIARFDPRKLYDAQGNAKPVHLLDDDTAMAISGVEIEELRLGTAGDVVARTITKKIKTADRNRANDMLMRHHNQYAAEARTQGGAMGQALGEVLARAQETGGGVPALITKKRKA